MNGPSSEPQGFAALSAQAPDQLLRLIALHRDDPRPDKLDLGVGVYRDAAGRTPVMRAVKEAERRLVAEQPSKAYLGAEGDIGFTAHIARLVFGDAPPSSDRLFGVQTPGGTGALRLGAELIARANPDTTVWLGTPTWPNHGPIFIEAGLRVREHPFYARDTATIAFEVMVATLEREARAGDVLLLHGCCHNPTGAGFSAEQWAALTALAARRGLMPFVDLAYQGLGDGLEADAAPARRLLLELPEALLAYSCDKNFGLYRDRVGALFVTGASAEATALVRSNLLALGRSLWSMPPDHGAAIVRLILDDPALAADWQAELAGMRDRLNGLRLALARACPPIAALAEQRGMFALLPLDRAAILALRNARAIYMAENGRINIAGLGEGDVPGFAEAIRPMIEASR